MSRCTEHDVPYPCHVPIEGHWMIEDGGDGWYVVRPWGQGRCGPFTEDEAGAMLPILEAQYPNGVASGHPPKETP